MINYFSKSVGVFILLAVFTLGLKCDSTHSFLPTVPTPPVAAPGPTNVARIPVPKKRRSYLQGMASWYGEVLEGHTTASGEIFEKDAFTACHPTLPFGTMVRVTNLHNRKTVIVRINDRGILFPDRVIDLSSAAADALGMLRAGVAPVRLEVLPRLPG